MGSIFLASEMDNEKNKKQPLPQVSSLAILGLQSANSGGKACLVPRHSFPQNLTLDKSQHSLGIEKIVPTCLKGIILFISSKADLWLLTHAVVPISTSRSKLASRLFRSRLTTLQSLPTSLSSQVPPPPRCLSS